MKRARVMGMVGSLLLHAIVAMIVVVLARLDSARPVTRMPEQAEAINISLNAFSKKSSQPSPAIAAPVATQRPEPAVTSPGKIEPLPHPKPTIKPKPDIDKAELPKSEPLPVAQESPKKKHSQEVTLKQASSTEQNTAITSPEPTQITTVTAPPAPAADHAVQNSKDSTDSAQIADYAAGVRLAVLSQRTYPQRAKRKKMTGTVVVTFRVFADGTLDLTAVSRSSGYKILDRAALGAVNRVSKFKPFPEEISRQFWDFEVPIVFQ